MLDETTIDFNNTDEEEPEQIEYGAQLEDVAQIFGINVQTTRPTH